MKRLLRTLAGLALVAALGGCSLGYYAQSVGGHLDLMQRARPVEQWVADPATPDALRERLRLRGAVLSLQRAARAFSARRRLAEGRAAVAEMTPVGKEGECFGLWGFAGKLAGIGGPLAFGGVAVLFGMRSAILINGVWFLLGGLLLGRVRLGNGKLVLEPRG